MLKVINPFKDKQVYTQRNNKYVWERGNCKINFADECPVTSMVMALDYAGFTFPKGKYEQPEDNLADYIMSSRLIDSTYSLKFPALYKKYEDGDADALPPISIHTLLALGTNSWMGVDDLIKFDTKTSTNDIFNSVLEGKPVVMSMSVPSAEKNYTYNHIVVLTGFEYTYNSRSMFETGIKDITDSMKHFSVKIIFDDPYGHVDDNGAYYDTNQNGKGNMISCDNFFKWFKNICYKHNKFAHLIAKDPVALV